MKQTSEAKQQTLKAKERAVEALRAKEADRARVAAAQAAERAERLSSRRHLDAVKARETARGEDVSQAHDAAPVVVLSRDGLEWLYTKGVISRPLHAAGRLFREDFEAATPSLPSCLGADAVNGGGFGPKSGPTDGALQARDRMVAALFALRQADLVKYVKLIAGEGRMLTDQAFVDDARRVGEHKIPARIAFELLARHYGLIR